MATCLFCGIEAPTLSDAGECPACQEAIAEDLRESKESWVKMIKRLNPSQRMRPNEEIAREWGL